MVGGLLGWGFFVVVFHFTAYCEYNFYYSTAKGVFSSARYSAHFSLLCMVAMIKIYLN